MLSNHYYHLFSSVQSLSRVRLYDPRNCSIPGFPVHHQVPELTQTHVHRVGDAILCCPLLPSIFPSIGVFSNESVLHIIFAQGEDLCLLAQSPSFGDPCEFDGIHAYWEWVCAQMWPTGVYHPVATVTGSEVGMLQKKSQFWLLVGTVSLTCFSLLLLL